jgi:hypothetical protein
VLLLWIPAMEIVDEPSDEVLEEKDLLFYTGQQLPPQVS